MRQVISIWELYDQGSHHDYNESPTLLKRSTFEINEIVLWKRGVVRKEGQNEDSRLRPFWS